jgi:cation diffusion facilitator family transporter
LGDQLIGHCDGLMADESEGTVLLAGAANLAIAISKAIAGLLSGSTALLAEAAHSVADTLNQVFLLAALRRSRRPADARHPFGYGKERYFWSLLAAVGIFVLGAGFSMIEGIRAIFRPEPIAELVIVYAVLGVSFVFEGISWLKAFRQLRREAAAHRVPTLEHLREHAEPAVKTVAFEDTAALIGLVLAAIGVTLSAVTGLEYFDGAASIAIGILLIVIAFVLGRDNMAMLIGQGLPDDLVERIRAEIAKSPGVDAVLDVLTMRLGPDQVLVAAKVDLEDSASAAAVELLAEQIDQQIRQEFPIVRHLFLDPTPADRLSQP